LQPKKVFYKQGTPPNDLCFISDFFLPVSHNIKKIIKTTRLWMIFIGFAAYLSVFTGNGRMCVFLYIVLDIRCPVTNIIYFFESAGKA
jgi:hypothetical protein